MGKWLKVIATRGDGIYLLDLGGGQGAILNTEFEPPRIGPSEIIDSILKFGYWDEFDGDSALIEAAAARAVKMGRDADGDKSDPGS
jgi:hypothetical protein